jgi:small-conductance mechanosensitive channel
MSFNTINIIPLTAAIAFLAAFFAITKYLKYRLQEFLIKQQLFFGAKLLSKIKWPIRTLGLAIASEIYLQIASQEHLYLGRWTVLPQVFITLSVLWFLDAIISVFISHKFSESISTSTQVLTKTLTRIILATLSLLIILDRLGISITPLLASLGIGSLAVALALQDTLSNFFSGIYLLADRPIRIGDFIRLENGTEGYVKRIGWRTTQIQISGNSMAMVPNSKLSSSLLINYDLPEADAAINLDIGISYQTDLQKAEEVIYAVAKHVIAHSEITIKDAEPIVRFKEFGNTAIISTITLRLRHFDQQAQLKHELIKALHSGLKEAGIEIPVPQQYLAQIK